MPASIRFHTSPEYGTVGCTVGIASDLYVGAYGEDAAEALHKAADMAATVSKFVEQHPELRAALSIVPGSGLALTALSSASKALKYGVPAAHIAAKYGPKVAKVASKLLSIF